MHRQQRTSGTVFQLQRRRSLRRRVPSSRTRSRPWTRRRPWFRWWTWTVRRRVRSCSVLAGAVKKRVGALPVPNTQQCVGSAPSTFGMERRVWIEELEKKRNKPSPATSPGQSVNLRGPPRHVSWEQDRSSPRLPMPAPPPPRVRDVINEQLATKYIRGLREQQDLRRQPAPRDSIDDGKDPGRQHSEAPAQRSEAPAVTGPVATVHLLSPGATVWPWGRRTVPAGRSSGRAGHGAHRTPRGHRGEGNSGVTDRPRCLRVIDEHKWLAYLNGHRNRPKPVDLNACACYSCMQGVHTVREHERTARELDTVTPMLPNPRMRGQLTETDRIPTRCELTFLSHWQGALGVRYWVMKTVTVDGGLHCR